MDDSDLGGGDRSVTEETPDLLNMTKSQLIDYAQEQGVSVSSRMTKAQIRDAIEENENGNLDG